MRKLIPIEIDFEDLRTLYKYGFCVERNVEQYLKDVAAEIRYYEFKEKKEGKR